MKSGEELTPTETISLSNAINSVESSAVSAEQGGTLLGASSLLTVTQDLVYSTFIGGNSYDAATAIDVDTSGAVYATGSTASTDFPVKPGAFQDDNAGGNDIFVVKSNPDGSALEYATYLGGSDNEIGQDIAVDASGEAFVVGRTHSSDYPHLSGTCVTMNGEDKIRKATITKLSADGTYPIYSICLGGTKGEEGHSVAVNHEGEAYMTGQTASDDFPTTVGAYDREFNLGSTDGFVAKFDPGGGLIYSTYLGGKSLDCEIGFNNQECAIAVDASGSAYIVGSTYSDDLPTRSAYDSIYNGNQDIFIAKLNPEGSDLIYLTYLGSSGDDGGDVLDIVVDNAGAAYVTGSTNSPNFPHTLGSYHGGWDPFAIKLSPSGRRLVYSALWGGTQDDKSRSVAVNTSGEALC